jgi:hypothetical protein
MNIPQRHHQGTIAHEATMAIIIATVVLTGTAQILAVVSQQRRAMRHEAVARRELGNLMEEIAARPWNEVTADALADLKLSEQCQDVLREPRLKIGVAPETDGVGRHVRVEIDWLANHEERALPLRLSAWRYPERESNE